MRLLGAVFVLAVAASPAGAQPDKANAQAVYQDGKARYMREDYEGAAEQFRRAYELDPDPVYLFNVAQAYRLGKQCALAREYYQRYLDEAKQAPNADTVREYLREVDECAKWQTPPQVAPSPRAEPPVETGPADTTSSSQAPLPAGPPPETPTSSRGNTRTIGIVVGAVGAALAVNGVYFLTRVGDAEDEIARLEGACSPWTDACQRRHDDIDARGRRDEKIMIGSFVVGGAAIATGAVLFVLGGQRSGEAPIAITPTRGGAMVSLTF